MNSKLSKYLYILLSMFFTENLFAEKNYSFGSLLNHKIELGIDYPIFQSIKFQNSIVADNHTHDFQHTATAEVPSPYISMKSRAFDISNNWGVYINSTARFINFSTQRPFVTSGGIYNDEVDIDTSSSLVTIDMSPSIFYANKNFIFEIFGGVGGGASFGDRKEFKYVAESDADKVDNSVISNIEGKSAYIGESEKISLNGLLLSYGIRFKYKISQANLHIAYISPVIIGKEFLIGNFILIGLGYTF